MVRRLVSLLAACGVVLGGLTLGASPASATGEAFASLTPSSGAAGSVVNLTAVVTLDTNAVNGSSNPTQAGYFLTLPGFDFSGLSCSQVTFSPALSADADARLEGFCIGFSRGKGGLNFASPYITGTAAREYSITITGLTAPRMGGTYDVGLANWDASETFATQPFLAEAPDGAFWVTLDIDGNGGTCQTSKVTGYSTTWALAPGAGDCSKAGQVFTGFNTSADGSGLAITPGGNLHLTGDNRLYAVYEAPRAPGAPTNAVAVAGRNQVTVSWQPPTDPGSLPIANYLVQAAPSGKVCITSVANANPLSCTLSLPATNTQYTFTVQALNGAGWGDLSAASNAVSPFNVILDTATRTQDRVLLVFKGGSTLSVSGRGPGIAPGTVITPQVRIGSGDWVSETRDLPKVGADRSISWSRKLAKSLNGTPVQVRLTLGDVATDPASLKVGSRYGVPDAPRNVKVVPERGGVRLSWEAPDNDGGSPVTSYAARADVNGLTPSCRVVAGNPLTCVVPLNTSRVAAGTTISFTVTALSARGEGAPAKASLRGPLRWVDIRTVGTGGAPGGKTELRLGVQSNGFEIGDAFTVELKIGADGQWEKQKGRLVISESAGLSGSGDWSGIVPSEALKRGYTVRVSNPKAAPDTWTQKPRP